MKTIVARIRRGKTLNYLSAVIFALALCAALTASAADWTDANNVTYTALKSLNGGGSGYIATDFTPLGTDTVKFKYKPSTVSGNECIYCSRYSVGGSMKNQFCGFRIGSVFRIDSHDYYSKAYPRQYDCNTTKPLTAGTEYTLSADYYNAAVTINGTPQTLSGTMLKSSSTDYTPGSILVLLASHTSTSANAASADTLTGISYEATGDLYYFQLWSYAGALSHNFMPASRDSDSAVGLYDTVTGKFYPATDGSLTGATYDASERAGKKWTGLGGDNKMSTAANWENNDKPAAGDDVDFTIAAPNAAIVADIGATFGKIYLGAGDVPAFSGALTATAISDLTRMQAYDTATEGFTFTLEAPSGQDFTWNGGTSANWSTTDASWLYNSAASVWYDNNNAIFNTAGATATLTEDATADSLVFSQPATVAGSATLTAPTVSVVPNVSATISAPTAGALTKTGAGTLTLGSSRTEQTTLTEGTLAMASGATLDVTKLTLGTDPAKPVSLNLGGAGLSADLTARMSATVGGAAGGSVAIDNGAITNTADLRVRNGSLTLGSNVQVMMNGSDTWVCVGGNGTSDESVTTNDAYLVLDGASIKESVSSRQTSLAIGDYGKYPSKATMIVKNGGSYTTDNSAYVAQGCEGHLVIDGEGSSVTAYQLHFCEGARCADDENGYAVVTNSGTLVVDRLGYGSGNGEGYFRFDGGTLRAKTTNQTLLPAHEKLHYEVGELGGTIDNDDKNITIAKGFSGSGTLNLTGSGTTTFAEGVGAEGGVSVANGTTLALSGATQSSLGAVTLEAGSTIDIATPASDDAAFAATSLNLPAEGTVALTSGGGAFVKGLYAICEMSGVTAADGAKFAPSNGTLAVSWSVDGDMLMLAVGDIDPNTWTGRAGDGNLSNPENWLGRAVPTSGTATINTSGELTVGTLFKPDVIVFPETCGAVTIKGENAITGLAAVTNLSSSTCTFEVPVAFAGEICVSQGAYYGFANDGPVLNDGGKVRFAGGVTGSSFAEGTSRMLEGAYSVSAAADWQADEAEERLWSIVEGSLTISGTSGETPAPTDTHMLFVGTTGAFTTGVMRTSSRLSYRVYGEYVVTDELEVAMTADTYIAQRYGGTYKFEKLKIGGAGKNFYVANSTQKYGTKSLYIGAGGIDVTGTSSTALVLGFDNVNTHDTTHLYPWHSDYTIGGKGIGTRDLLIYRAASIHTDDESGIARTVTLDGIADVRAALTVNGHGKLQVNSDGMNGEANRIGNITVTDSATLAYASGADLGAGAVTVGVNATMEVASGVNTFGGLTVRDGATLAFNFTERAVTPQIAIAEGKTLTANGAVKVKIADGSLRPTGGEKVLTTCGGFDAEGVTVSLAEGAPKWVRGLSVNTDGNLVLDVKPMGTVILFR